MLPLISVVLVILGALGLKRLFPVIRDVRTRRRQIRFDRVFPRRLGGLCFVTRDVRPCDGYGAATTERRRLPGKPQHW
jgi:hypothetical protein